MGTEGRRQESNSGREDRERVWKAVRERDRIGLPTHPPDQAVHCLPLLSPLGGNRGEKNRRRIRRVYQFFIYGIPPLELGVLRR